MEDGFLRAVEPGRVDFANDLLLGAEDAPDLEWGFIDVFTHDIDSPETSFSVTSSMMSATDFVGLIPTPECCAADCTLSTYSPKLRPPLRSLVPCCGGERSRRRLSTRAETGLDSQSLLRLAVWFP